MCKVLMSRMYEDLLVPLSSAAYINSPVPKVMVPKKKALFDENHLCTSVTSCLNTNSTALEIMTQALLSIASCC